MASPFPSIPVPSCPIPVPFPLVHFQLNAGSTQNGIAPSCRCVCAFKLCETSDKLSSNSDPPVRPWHRRGTYQWLGPPLVALLYDSFSLLLDRPGSSIPIWGSGSASLAIIMIIIMIVAVENWRCSRRQFPLRGFYPKSMKLWWGETVARSMSMSLVLRHGRRDRHTRSSTSIEVASMTGSFSSVRLTGPCARPIHRHALRQPGDAEKGGTRRENGGDEKGGCGAPNT